MPEAHARRKPGVDTGGGGGGAGVGGGGGAEGGAGMLRGTSLRREGVGVGGMLWGGSGCGGGVGGGPREGGGGGTAAAATVLVRTWTCWTCSFRNWPSRVGCRVCGGPRRGTERRQEEVWVASRIPPGCLVDAVAPSGGRGIPAVHRGQGAGGDRGFVERPPSSRRVPGLAPPPTGRRVLPSSSSGLPGAGGRTTPAGERQPQHLQQNSGGTGRGKEAGDGNEGVAGANAGTGTGTGDGTGTETDGRTTMSWAKVVRGQKGKRVVVPEGRMEDGDEDQGRDEGEERGVEGGESSEDGLPPLRTFVPPSEPREAILRRAEAAAARARRAKEVGAKEEKVRRTQAQAELMAKRLRDAGGASATTLLFQIKGEERKKKEQSAKAIEQLQRKIADEEEEILNRRVAIQKLHRAVERHEGRLEASERRLAYLAAQKHAESIPLGDVAQLRAAAARLAARKEDDMSIILDYLAKLIPPECHELDEGDTSGAEEEEQGSATEEEMDEDGASRHIDWADYGGAYAQPLRAAKDELSQAQRAMLEAVDAARRAAKGANRRPLGEDGPRGEDAGGGRGDGS